MPSIAVSHILFATDFSGNAEAAQEQAVAAALHHGAQLTVVHSIMPLASPAGVLPAPEALMHTYRRAAQQRLEALVQRLAGRLTRIDCRLVFGAPHRALLEVAEELEPDLLVLGTRGLNGFKHLLLGSTARRVIQHSRWPVLTVPSITTQRQHPIARVLVPTDFSDDAAAALATAHLLATGSAPLHVILLNVYYSPILYTAYGSVPTTLDYLEDYRGEALAALADVAAEIGRPGDEITTLAEEGAPAQVILDVAQEQHVDLIAMGTRGREGLSHLLLGSTAERVVMQSLCPVLTVSQRQQEVSDD